MIKGKSISNQFIETISGRLSENKQVRRSLPIWGRVHIDRQLPFLCVYRRLEDDENSLSERLITGEASYLIAQGKRNRQKEISALVQSIARTLKSSFGSFLIVEIWIRQNKESESKPSSFKPGFKIFHFKKSHIASTVETLESALKEIKIRKERAEVTVEETAKVSPPGLPPIISKNEANTIGCDIIGIEIKSIHQNNQNQVFPLIRRDLQRRFSRALKNSFFEFTNKHTPYRPMHYHSLGRWSMVKAVWEADRQLADICSGFDFLLQVTPTNTNAAWAEFKKYSFEKTPEFKYRPLPIDPSISKRKLFKIPLERIEDPTLAQLFREQQLELDRKFTMLNDRGTERFLYGSLQVYGSIKEPLIKLALELLSEPFPPQQR